MHVINKLGQTVLAVIGTSMVLSLTACGQTGDLYLPESEEQKEQHKGND